MSESMFSNPSEARQFLVDLTDQMAGAMLDHNPDDLLGMYSVHDARILMAVRVTKSALETATFASSEEQGVRMATLENYLQTLDQLLVTSIAGEPGEVSTLDEWDWRLESMMRVGELTCMAKEKRGLGEHPGELLLEPVRLNYRATG